MKWIAKIFVAFLLAGPLAAAIPAHAQDDVVMKAMRDELNRSMKQLQLEKLEKPYFIAYRVVDTDSTDVSAAFGALESSREGRSRHITVEVRVGSYQLDNTNFFSFNFNLSSMVQAFNGTAELPLDDDYKELRRHIWLVTDSTYKKAVEDLAKKRAALENKLDIDKTPDFSQEAPTQTAEDGTPVHVDRAQWETEARNLSALFRTMPGIYTSSVSFSATNNFARYVNSEGTWYTRQDSRVRFDANATTQAADGVPLEDSASTTVQSLNALSGSGALAARIQKLGQELEDLRAAKEIATYNGPVLVESDAAAQLFRSVFLPHLLGVRQPMMESMQGLRDNTPTENPFLDKIGGRVLPDFLSVTDDPTLTELNGKPLVEFSKVDEDGVPTRKTLLVDKGILKTLLTTRDPVRGFEHSTGSRHDGEAMPSNVIVTAENGLSQDELRAKFLAMLKQENKEWGIVLRRMKNANQPLLAYKVYTDGHDELIHGVQLSGLDTSAFKDIVAVSKDQNIHTTGYRPEALIGIMSRGDEGFTLVTLAVPSLLFDDVTVRKIRKENSTPPIVPSPFASGP